MPLLLEELRSSAAETRTRLAKSLEEAAVKQFRTAFLCHSHADRIYAKGAVNRLERAGWRVYIDWEDAVMPQTPNKETAERIKAKIRTTDYFLFLATPNSVRSRWCPWEIGYADAKKPHNRIIVIPTRDSDGANHGNEYLTLYRHIDLGTTGELGVFSEGASETTVRVGDLS